MLLAVFCMFIFLIISVNIGTTKYKKNQIQMIQNSMEVLASNQKVQFEQYIDNKVSLLQGLVKFPEIYEMDMEDQKTLIKGHSSALGFYHLFIMQDNGNGYYIEEDLCRDQKDEPFFRDVMDNDVFITEPFYGGNATTMTISVSILDEDGKKVGALCGAIELKTIEKMFRENEMFMNGKSYLINREGNYVTAKDMQRVYKRTKIYDEENSDVSLIKKAFDNNADQQGVITQNGKEYQANVTYLPDFDWVIVQCIQTEEILKDLKYVDTWRYVALSIVVIIILCVIRITIYWNRSNKKMNIDTLTGCGSRVAMQNVLDRLDSIKKYNISLIYFDLNKFKEINDSFGHDYGDKVLCAFSNVLMGVFGKIGYVGRIGGDEFMVILINSEEKEIMELCEKLEQQLQEKSKELNLKDAISTSYGIATRQKGSSEKLHDIVNKADARMYRHKEQFKKEMECK